MTIATKVHLGRILFSEEESQDKLSRNLQLISVCVCVCVVAVGFF